MGVQLLSNWTFKKRLWHQILSIYSHELNYIGASTCFMSLGQSSGNWNLICFQLLWEIKTNWTIQTTLGLIKCEGQNWGVKLRGTLVTNHKYTGCIRFFYSKQFIPMFIIINQNIFRGWFYRISYRLIIMRSI